VPTGPTRILGSSPAPNSESDSSKLKSEKQSKIFAPTIKAASKGKVRAKEGKFEGIPTQLQAISGQLGQQGPSAAPPSGVKRITSKTKRSARAKVA